MNDPFIKYPTNNSIGFIRAYAGDGVVTERVHAARGTVQPQTSPTICTQRGGGCGVVTENVNDLRIRYLTPRECLRLMGFDDPSIDRLMAAVPSKTNQYKLAGNSIVVDCLESIFKAIYIDKTFKRPRPKQVTLFDIPERPINPVLMRSAEDIEREVSEIETLEESEWRLKGQGVEISGDSIVEKGGDYIGGIPR